MLWLALTAFWEALRRDCIIVGRSPRRGREEGQVGGYSSMAFWRTSKRVTVPLGPNLMAARSITPLRVVGLVGLEVLLGGCH